ncbi:hypothetical protein FJZ31_41950 [Candidatus Poribacteria bacterium]|nr:hypothetical protein [Candidatus Poribacteria bacterium]
MSTNWYKQTTRKIHFDMHTPESVKNVGRDFNPQVLARSVKEARAEVVCFFSRCAYGWSYYPTEVGLPHPHLTRDVFGDEVKAMKAEGIRVLAYVAIDNIPTPLAGKHPEWCNHQPDGTPRTGHGSGTLVCPSQFPEESLIPQLCEIARLYEVDGFFLDGVYQYFNNVCYGEHCRQAFGRDIPREPDDPNWRAFRHWQVQSIWAVLGKAAEAVAQVRPGCVLGVNWLASTRWSVPPPEAIGYLTGDPPLHNCTFETAYHLAAWAWREQPADLMTERMLHHWQDFTCRTPETIETEFATGLAAGGKLFIGDLLQPVEVSPDLEVMRLVRRCFDFAAQRESLTKNVHSVSDIAILSSPETIRQRGANWTVDETPIRGTYLALIENGLTADVLYDGDLEENLSRYKALVVPEQRFISRKAAHAIQQFVEVGGGLVVIGAIPECVAPTEPDSAADASIFEAITGLADEGEYPFNLGYLLLRGTSAEGFWRDGDDFRPAIPVSGKSAKVRAVKAETLAPLTAPGQTYQIGALPPGETMDSPALTLHHYGKGVVIFCALPIATDLWRRGNPGAKYVLQKMARRVTPEFGVERMGPSGVQVFRSEGTGKTVVHLVAYTADRRTERPQIVESPPIISGVKVKLLDSRNPITIHVEPGKTMIQAKRDGRYLIVEPPPFVLHTAVVFDWK